MNSSSFERIKAMQVGEVTRPIREAKSKNRTPDLSLLPHLDTFLLTVGKEK